MNPLPAIIKELPNVLEPPAPIELDDVKFDPAKKFILCITRDLSKADKTLLRHYELVEYDDQIHKNIKIDAFPWDILVFDLRQKSDRYALMKEVLPYRAKYHVICYCHGFEVEDIDIECDNIFSSFPAEQALKADFEMLLLMKRIKKPKWYIALASCMLSFLQQTKK
jgi:hypothetical protein